jgi:hypothetical protein
MMNRFTSFPGHRANDITAGCPSEAARPRVSSELQQRDLGVITILRFQGQTEFSARIGRGRDCRTATAM